MHNSCKSKKTMKHISCKICDETIRSWMMLCIACIITDDKSSHLTLSNSLMNRHVACLQGRGCVAEEPYWKIRKWCYCCSLLTNVCNRMHTGPRAGSNPSKNFASTTGEQTCIVVIEVGFSKRGARQPLATACDVLPAAIFSCTPQSAWTHCYAYICVFRF